MSNNHYDIVVQIVVQIVSMSNNHYDIVVQIVSMSNNHYDHNDIVIEIIEWLK